MPRARCSFNFVEFLSHSSKVYKVKDAMPYTHVPHIPNYNLKRIWTSGQSIFFMNIYFYTHLDYKLEMGTNWDDGPSTLSKVLHIIFIR